MVVLQEEDGGAEYNFDRCGESGCECGAERDAWEFGDDAGVEYGVGCGDRFDGVFRCGSDECLFQCVSVVVLLAC